METTEKTTKNYVGIDVHKKMLEVARLRDSAGKIERQTFTTGGEGITHLLEWLTPEDVIALETGNQSFRLAKTLILKGFDAIVLNAGDLAVIYKSLKKTDREDALKLARLISRIPREELPLVEIPSDEMEDARRLSTEQATWTKQRTALINRLHSIFTQAGRTEITKKDLSSINNREKVVCLLSTRYISEAKRLCQMINHFETMLAAVHFEINQLLDKELSFTTLAMSMPGVGPVTALVLFSYLGDCRRFSNGKQVAYYAGFVPRVDSSGDTIRYGGIIKHGAQGIRRVMVQSAWSLVHSKNGNELTLFYERLKATKGKGKAIVAVARKMLCVFYAMMTSGELYRGVELEDIFKKIKNYGIHNF